MAEEKTGVYIYKIKRKQDVVLLPCLIVSNRDAKEALAEAATKCKEAGIPLDSFADIPEKILASCCIYPIRDIFNEIDVDDQVTSYCKKDSLTVVTEMSINKKSRS